MNNKGNELKIKEPKVPLTGPPFHDDNWRCTVDLHIKFKYNR